MATKLENLPLEIAHFNNFKHLLPHHDRLDMSTVELLLEWGVLQISSMYELAIANVGGYSVVSEDEKDLDCPTIGGSDAKMTSVRTSSYGTSYSAPVYKTTNKTGSLRVQVYERKLEKFYYFVIPKVAHAKVSKTSNIEIPFELDGTPKRNYSPVKLPNWWRYEVKTFDDLATIIR